MRSRPRVKSLFGPEVFAATLASYYLIACFIAYSEYRYQPLWTIGDWLINYKGGFIRRGLPGELFLLASTYLHIPVAKVALVVPALIYALFLVAVYKLANPLRRSCLWFALLFSPATIPFIVLNGFDIAFRKETLVLASLACFILALRRGYSDAALSVALSISVSILVLSHEGTIICMPYFIAAAAIAVHPRRTTNIAVVPICSAVVLLSLVGTHAGTPVQASAICKAVNGRWSDLPAGAKYPGMDGETGICDGYIA